MTHTEAVGNTKLRVAAAAVVVLSPEIVAYARRRNFDGLKTVDEVKSTARAFSVNLI